MAEASPSVSELLEKLAAFEKRLAELELKSKSTALTEEALERKNRAYDNEVRPRAKIDSPYLGKAPSEEEEESFDPRVKVITSRRNPETGEPIEEKSNLKTFKHEDNNELAFTLRKIVFDTKFAYYQNDNSSEIEIISLGLWDLLKKHLGHYPYHMFRDTPVTLESPYEPLVFQFDELNEVAQQPPSDSRDKLAREDLARLLKVISEGASGDEKLDKYFKMRPNYKKPVLESKKEPETIQFVDLWTAFPPGTLIYGTPFQNQDQVFVVKDNRVTWPIKDPMRRGGSEYNFWTLDAWSYDWRDGSFRRTDLALVFEHFDGHLPLTSLPYFPLHILQNRDAIKESLVARGKKFRRICEAKKGERLFEYRGQAIAEQTGLSGMKNDEEGETDFGSSISYDTMDLDRQAMLGSRRSTDVSIPQVKSIDIHSRVMVDYDSYFQYGPADGRNGPLEPANVGTGCACSDCQNNEGLVTRFRAWIDDPKYARAKVWEPEQYLLCPPRVLGYILQEKRWAQLQVTSLNSIKPPTEDNIATWFSHLALADDPDPTKPRRKTEKRDTRSTKSLLFDLIRSHKSSSSSDDDDEGKDKLEVDDIIPGKGKGLIILLYGPPGVGKTSTAETVAVASRKPLFSVSVADVGTKAKNVESNLSRIFSLATRWKAILLLDEADVFLETRSHGNKVQTADKNALVSVFLRVLEYYQGIMFLTTNQIASFDVAIPSRVHVAIRYESLNKRQMECIFRGFLDRLDENAIDDYDEIVDSWFEESIFKAKFDGRQIRNTVTVALGLARAARRAEGSDGKLTKEHLRRAFDNVSAFKNDFRVQMERYKQSQSDMIK